MAFYKGGALKWTPSEDGDIHRGDVRINAHHPMMALHEEGAPKCSPTKMAFLKQGTLECIPPKDSVVHRRYGKKHAV